MKIALPDYPVEGRHHSLRIDRAASDEKNIYMRCDNCVYYLVIQRPVFKELLVDGDTRLADLKKVPYMTHCSYYDRR